MASHTVKYKIGITHGLLKNKLWESVNKTKMIMTRTVARVTCMGTDTHRLTNFLVEDCVCVLRQTLNGVKVEPLVHGCELATARLHAEITTITHLFHFHIENIHAEEQLLVEKLHVHGRMV